MRDRRHESEPEPAEQRPGSEAPPRAPHAILALQQSAGNQAVSGMRQRVITIGTDGHDWKGAKRKLEELEPKPTITQGHVEWLRRLDQGNKTFESAEKLKDELNGVPPTAHTGALPRVNLDQIRFSQSSIAG